MGFRGLGGLRGFRLQAGLGVGGGGFGLRVWGLGFRV